MSATSSCSLELLLQLGRLGDVLKRLKESGTTELSGTERDLLVARHLAFAFEVPDAVFVHDDLADLERLRRLILSQRGHGEQGDGGERQSAFHGILLSR